MKLRATVGLLVFLFAATAHGHGRSVSYSDWVIDGEGGTVRVRIPLLDLSALEATGVDGALLAVETGAERTALEDHLEGRLQLFSRDERCAPEEGTFYGLGAENGFATFEWRVVCSSADQRVVRSALLFSAIPSHVHFVRLRVVGTSIDLDRALDEGHRQIEVPESILGQGPSFFGAFTGYVSVGFEHILSGSDHLLFLLVLLLAAISLRDLAIVVTGFTVAHSITLALSALGYATPRAAAVDAVIGLSIAIVAVENVWLSDRRRGVGVPATVVVFVLFSAVLAAFVGELGSIMLLGIAIFCSCHFGLLATAAKPERLRWAVASMFGLVHGFGFAGVLTEAELPPGRLAGALFGFNIGVELGQLLVVAAAWPVLHWVRRRGEAPSKTLVQWGSAAALCAGTFWFVSRGFT